MPEPEGPEGTGTQDEQVEEQSVSEKLGFSGPEEELKAIIARMDEIREQQTADLLSSWPSPWKNEAMVGAKVTGRLGSHKAFQVLLQRKRELEEDLGVSEVPEREMEDAEDPMGSYAINIAKQREAAAQD